MLPDLVTLSLFLKAVEARSISRAAEHSNMVVSAASRRLSQLEDRFGVRLLHRIPGGVEPTLAGEVLVAHASKLLGAVDQMDADLSDYASGGKGRVRLHANPSIIQQWMPEQLSAFAALQPSIKVEVCVKGSSEIVRALREGAADVGIITSGVASQGLHRRTLCAEPMCAVVPRNHPLRGPSISFSDLLAYEFVGLEESTAHMGMLVAAAAEVGQPFRVRAHARSFESVCRLVEAGFGVAVLPRGAAQVLRRGMALRLVHFREPWKPRAFVLCTPQEQVPVAVRKLIAHLFHSAEPGSTVAAFRSEPC
jgi:DNA-binding transcriptional LysR family regulator